MKGSKRMSNTKQEELQAKIINVHKKNGIVLKFDGAILHDIGTLINSEVTAVLNELEEQSIDANYYIPNSPDDTYTNGEAVRVEAIQSIKEKYQ